VIASVSGATAVILVTEPSLSGLHDLERILKVARVARHFRIPAYLVINKFDLNEEMNAQIEEFSKQEGLPLLGRIPYDPMVPRMMIAGKSAVEDSKSRAGMRKALQGRRCGRSTKGLGA